MTISEIRNELAELYKTWANYMPNEILELPISGSSRKYFRLIGVNGTVIGTYNDDLVENKAFFYLSEQLRKNGVNIPEVFISDESKCKYLQEDLGNTNLYEYATSKDKLSEDDLFAVYKNVIDQMPLIQYESAKDLDFTECYPREAFDRQSIQWDLNYFKYNFLKLVHIPFHEQKLEDEFQKLIEFALEAPSDFFLFRDFQSRNIMVKDKDVFFIDFQGGRRGALQYDLASLLFESKIGLSDSMRERIFNYYLEVFSAYSFFNKEEFKKYYPAFVLIRLLQAFGAYGYRGVFEKKAFFAKSIRSGLKNLLKLINTTNVAEQFPYLCEVIETMQGLNSTFDTSTSEGRLTVTITSFSYRLGLPDDWSGNGGGFVFDCRSIPNPGRIEQYRSSTGCDSNVIEFLDKEPEAREFASSTQELLARAVQKYIDRRFLNLSVSFGCTGGQHRSVYMAEQLFNYLKLNFDVNLRLIHREQKIDKIYDKDNVQEKP